MIMSKANLEKTEMAEGNTNRENGGDGVSPCSTQHRLSNPISYTDKNKGVIWEL